MSIALKLRTRAAASIALARVDPEGAVEALMHGFWQSGEPHRRGVVSVLQDEIPDRAPRKALDSMATRDTSHAFREAAKKNTRRGREG